MRASRWVLREAGGGTPPAYSPCAAGARGRRVQNEQLTAWTSCAKDEGGPLGIGFQERVPNQSKRQRSKDVVVSVGSKVRDGVVVRMLVPGNEAKRHRVIRRPLQLAAGKHAGGVAIHQDAQQHGWVIGGGPRAAVAMAHRPQIQPLDNFHHKARQVLFSAATHQPRAASGTRSHGRSGGSCSSTLSGLAANRRCDFWYGCPRGVKSDRLLEHRIGDKRILRLIQKWLRAGVLEDEVVTIEEKGTGQGSVISPLLANIYLHYVFDLWAARWRRREATGDMIMVRYADDSAPRRREEEALM